MSREGSGAQTVCGIGIATELTGEDHEILQVYAIFEALNEQLDRLVECDIGVPELVLRTLHGEWDQALSRATALPARTVNGQRAKATMLLAAMRVVLGTNHPDAEPHEALAASLARDLTR